MTEPSDEFCPNCGALNYRGAVRMDGPAVVADCTCRECGHAWTRPMAPPAGTDGFEFGPSVGPMPRAVVIRNATIDGWSNLRRKV